MWFIQFFAWVVIVVLLELIYNRQNKIYSKIEHLEKEIKIDNLMLRRGLN